MGLTTSYLINASKLERFLADLRGAQAPERFTIKFLEDLGYKSTNDRLFVGMLKALGFLDDNGAPTQRYFDFLDDTRWQTVLAEGVQEAYEDLFRLNKKAHNMSRTDVSGKLKSLTEGKKSEKVIENMTRTFLELTKLADFSSTERTAAPPPKAEAIVEPPSENGGSVEPETAVLPTSQGRLVDGLTYRIELVLPPVRDKAVYDALFRSLKEHLL